MEQVLLLNKSFEPIAIINWKRALRLFVLEKVEILEEYQETISSQNSIFNAPAVVRLTTNFKRINRDVSFTKNNVLIRDKFTCQYCLKKSKEEDLTLDHVLPRSRGGKSCWENIVTCCPACNIKKGNRTPAEAHMRLCKSPIKPDWVSLFNKTILKKEVPKEWEYFCYF